MKITQSLTYLKGVLYGLFLALPMAWVLAQEVVDVGDRWVTDLTETLTTGEINHIDEELRLFSEETGSQVLVVLIPTTGDYTIEQYGIALAEKTQAGREGIDDGVILLIAKNDRKLRIEVGYGLEGTLTDALSKRIIEQAIKPEFRDGHFYQGIENGLDAIMKAIKKEELPLPEETNADTEELGFWGVIIFLFFLIAFILLIVFVVNKVAGKSRGAILQFIITWVLAGIFFGFFGGLIAAAILQAITRGKGGSGGGGGGGYYSGGWSSGSSSSSWSSGGSSFGGFSGGGGSFGGGGASGSW